MSLEDSVREIWVSLEKHSWKGISSWNENSAQFKSLIDTVSGCLNRTTAFNDPVIQLGSHTGSKRIEIVVRIQEYLRSVNHDKDFDNLNMLLLERKSSKETQRLIELLNVRLIDIFFNMQNGIADVYKKILLACGYEMDMELKLADSLKQFKKQIQAADFKSKLSLQYSLQTITGQDEEHTVCQSWFITSDETMIIEKHACVETKKNVRAVGFDSSDKIVIVEKHACVETKQNVRAVGFDSSDKIVFYFPLETSNVSNLF